MLPHSQPPQKHSQRAALKSSSWSTSSRSRLPLGLSCICNRSNSNSNSNQKNQCPIGAANCNVLQVLLPPPLRPTKQT